MRRCCPRSWLRGRRPSRRYDCRRPTIRTRFQVEPPRLNSRGSPPMQPTIKPGYDSAERPLEAFQVVFVILGLIAFPAALTLNTVREPGVLEISSTNPTPLGYALSL